MALAGAAPEAARRAKPTVVAVDTAAVAASTRSVPIARKAGAYALVARERSLALLMTVSDWNATGIPGSDRRDTVASHKCCCAKPGSVCVG